MKLATLDDGAPDGRLVVVSHDLTRCSDASHLARTLQAALDDWDRLAPQLELIARGVETGGQPIQRFHERAALAPLPRGPHGLGFAAPRAPIALAGAGEGVAFDAEAAVVTGDVPMGADRTTALAAIRLVTLTGAARQGTLDPDASGAPAAVVPAALGPGWDGARLRGALTLDVNGRAFGRVDPVSGGSDFGDLIVRAARTRALSAGTVVGSGPLFARAASGAPLLRAGDVVRIDMRDAGGHSVFGAIERQVAAA